MRLAIRNDMSYLSFKYLGKLRLFDDHFLPINLLSSGIHQCNIRRGSRLAQLMAVYRTKHLRWMSTIFIEELLATFEEPDKT